METKLIIKENNSLIDAKGNVEPDHSHAQAEAAKLWDKTGMVPSTALLFPSYFSFLSPMTPSQRWLFLDLPCGALSNLTHHLPWQLSETPLLALLLCAAQLWKPQQSTS